MHPTIQAFTDAAAQGDHAAVPALMAKDVRFMPPTYWKTWTGRQAASAVLEHVMAVFEEFRYRRVMGAGADWALEFQCKVSGLDAVGADLVTLNDAGLIQEFEVIMRPHKSVGALREAMNARVMQDPRFLELKSALS